MTKLKPTDPFAALRAEYPQMITYAQAAEIAVSRSAR